MKWDVILYQDGDAGIFAPSWNAAHPTGGTEVHLVQLAEGLAEAGYSVLGLSGLPGVEAHRARYETFDPKALYNARALVTCGITKIPRNVRCDRHAVLWTHDPGNGILPHMEHLRYHRMVCVSEWQARRFPLQWSTAVIPAMIDDWIFDLPRLDKDPNRFVCVSAWWKGTTDTLLFWEKMRPQESQAKLYVGSAYSHPPNAREIVERAPHCEWIDVASPPDIIHALRTAAGTFRFCSSPETFGATDAIAQLLGCRPHVLCLRDRGALVETLRENPFVGTDPEAFESEFLKAYRTPPLDAGWETLDEPAAHAWHQDRHSKAVVIPKWIDLLGLR